MRYVFADCELDTLLYVLRRAGRVIALRPKVFQVLVYLLKHHDRVVSKHELLEAVWPEQFISDATLADCIRTIREAVGERSHAQRVIQTRHGHGYRCVADVSVYAPAEAVMAEPAAPPRPVAPPMVPAATTHEPLLASHITAVSPAPASTADTRSCPVCQILTPTAMSLCGGCGAQLPPALPAGERKRVTVLCCTLTYAHALREQLGLDGLHDVLRTLYLLVREVVQPYGGTLQSVVGERLVAVFGAPMAQEDHAPRAALAALALRQRVQAHRAPNSPHLEEGFAVGVGLHTGLIVLGGIGDEPVGTAALVGDVEPVAAALQAHATAGTILCSDTTARLLQGVVRFEPYSPLSVPGQTLPVLAYALLDHSVPRTPRVRRSARAMTQCVGRERELATLTALLACVESGQGQAIGIVGEPGLGKSRLLDEFRQRLAGKALTYLQGHCLSYGSTTPYLPLLDLLRHNCGITRTETSEGITHKVQRGLQEIGMDPATTAPYLLQLLEVQPATAHLATLSPKELKAGTFAALIQMCMHGSQQRPLVIAVEDLHWIDATSDECLATLVDRMAGVPILVVGTYRPGYRPAWLEKSYATQIALGPLNRCDSLHVVRAVLRTTQLPAGLEHEIIHKADGNPLFLEELAQTVVEHGAGRLPQTVPDTIEAVLATRIDRLPVDAKRLLQIAAVIGPEVPFTLLQTIAAVPAAVLHQHLGHLQRAEFLYETRILPEPVYAFKHVLTQEVAYQSLLQRTRQHYHAHIAQVLATRLPETVDAHPELVAHHYTEAGRSADALPYWRRGGEQAMRRSAPVEAVAHFTKGLALLQTLPETPEALQHALALHLAVGRAWMALKGHAAPEVSQAYRRARDLCQQMGDVPQLCPVLQGLVSYYTVQGELQTAYELAEQCLHLAQGHDDPVLLHVAYTYLGSVSFYLGDLLPARAYLEQSMALYDPSQGLAYALRCGQDTGVLSQRLLAWTLWLLGYPEQARIQCQHALALAHRVAHPFSLAGMLFYASVLHYLRRELEATRQQAEAAIQLCTAHGFPQVLAASHMKYGTVLVLQGQAEEGLRQLRQGLEAYQATGAVLGCAPWRALLGDMYGHTGQVEEGLRALEEALACTDDTGEQWWSAELYRLQGKLLLAQAEPWHHAAAEQSVRQALAIARQQQAKSLELRAAMDLSRLWQQQDKRHAARELLAEVYGWFTEGFDTRDLQDARTLLAALSS